ncbi:MAG: hypothetical protein SWQ30_06800 [Thermodesulfobacteriota bacterium]|nr:hypothetical protein [Thermodesulfobacteriota bacterium]
METIQLDRGIHKSFDYIVNSLLSYSFIGAGLNSYVGCNMPRQNAEIAMGGNPKVSNLAIGFRPFRILETIFRGGWPNNIELLVYKLPNNSNINAHPKIPRANVLTGAGYALGFNMMSSFVSFYESVKERTEEKFGANPNNWPATLNFCRVIRNAFSHNGVIDFRNKKAAAVSWRSLRYSPSDNGSQILFRDLACAEIILLMVEFDAFLV